MKKVLLIIGLLLTVVLVSSYNYPDTWTGKRSWAYENKTLEIMHDSKKRPHKIVIYSKFKEGITAIDLDAEKKIIVNLKHKCEFKPFDKVVVRCGRADKWSIDFFSYKVSNGYICTGDAWFGYCLPYNEETAHLLGTTDDWEGGENERT